jgi:hypothetical protein
MSLSTIIFGAVPLFFALFAVVALCLVGLGKILNLLGISIKN